MARKPREIVDGGFYHVVHRGNHQKAIFEEREDYGYFLHLLERLKEKYPFELHHYCLMTNHVHLLAMFPRGQDLPKWGHALFRGYSGWHQARYALKGHLWQERFKSPRIDSDSYLLECGRYIERNPVRAGLVQQMEDYPWSSYRFYAFGEPSSLVSADPFYEGLGLDASSRRKSYRDFLAIETPYAPMLDQELIERRH